MDAIRAKQLSKSYDKKQSFAVYNLNLEIEKGQIFGLLGPNGAGKTTLLSMMSGLLKPTSGTLEIDELTYSNDRNKILGKIGVVPQEYALYPTLTAFENLSFFGSLYNLKGNDLKSKIENGLEKVGLLDYKNKMIKNFSGGMKRRINLLTGILHEPEILFLDEPTVGVDIQSKEVIFEILNELNQHGTTIIYTSHMLNEAQNFCTEICIMDKGMILTKGIPIDLIQKNGTQNLEELFLNLTGTHVRNDA